jgi:hypothetical protein
MRRTLVIASLALTTMLGGCAVTPYYGPPTIYPAPVVYTPRVYQYNNGYSYHEQRRWNSWYRCQQVYGNRARCVY